MPFYSRKSNKRSRNANNNNNSNAAAIDPPSSAPSMVCGPCSDDTANMGSSSVSYYHIEPTKPPAANYINGNGPQHSYLPKTMSAATAATVTSSRSMYSNNSTSSSYSRTSSPESIKNLCPVTGVFANITDDYYILPTIIGKGHYGIVRECIHRATHSHTLAVKSVDKSKIGRLDHLQREIFLLANVNHRGIMKMVDCYEDEKYVHIITEKYSGGELFDKIVEQTNGQGCFNERRAAGVIKNLLEAVEYLHENGVVHRDIKPENVLFDSNNEEGCGDDDDCSIKLIDFGLSRRHVRGIDSPMTNPVGTAYYMSPELLKGKYDAASDIWSVGIVTYILLCGYPPFNGSSDSEIQESTRRGRLHFQGNAWFNKSDDAMDFVKCLLRKDARKRFSAREALCHPWIRKHVSSSF